MRPGHTEGRSQSLAVSMRTRNGPRKCRPSLVVCSNRFFIVLKYLGRGSCFTAFHNALGQFQVSGTFSATASTIAMQDERVSLFSLLWRW